LDGYKYQKQDMREIKFRAWDKHSKPNKMVAPREGDFIGWHSPSNWRDCYCVMQYTNLKDKNGKEIYEGDIVSYYNKYSRKTYTHIVKWDDKWACFGLFDENSEWCKESDWFKIEKIEVLGNIYEHPHLLKTE